MDSTAAVNRPQPYTGRRVFVLSRRSWGELRQKRRDLGISSAILLRALLDMVERRPTLLQPWRLVSTSKTAQHPAGPPCPQRN
jgi:hypothetical protein